MSRKLILSCEDKGLFTTIDMNTLVSHSQPQNQTEGELFCSKGVFGYKNNCVHYKRDYFSGLADAQLINLETNHCKPLNGYIQLMFLHSTRKGVLCIAHSSRIIHLIDMNSGQQIDHFEVDFEIKGKVSRMLLIGRYLLTLDEQGMICSCDLKAVGKKTLNQELALDYEYASVFDFNKKTGELFAVSATFALLVKVDDWQESSTQPIKFDIITMLIVDICELGIRLNKSIGYDYLLCHAKGVTLVNLQKQTIKKLVTPVFVMAVHSQRSTYIKVIGYNVDSGSVGIYRLAPTAVDQMSLEQKLKENVKTKAHLHAYVEPEPKARKRLLQSTMRTCQLLAKLTDLYIL